MGEVLLEGQSMRAGGSSARLQSTSSRRLKIWGSALAHCRPPQCKQRRGFGSLCAWERTLQAMVWN